MVYGPAGIGKTRLVEEFVAGLEVPVGWGAALAEVGMPPLWPLTRALRRLAEPRAALATLVAGVADGDSGSADDAAARTFAADTAVLDAIEAEAEPAGLVLVLDDLQWADAATVRVLARLAAAIRRLRLLVVATHRDADDPALVALLAHSGTEVRVLHPLSPDAAEALLATMVEQLDSAAARQAVARSGGSPLYLRTVASVAAEQLRGRAAWQDPATAPELRQLVAAGLRACGPDTADAVAVASAAGPQVPDWLVAGLLRLAGPDDARTLLRPAGPAGLIEIGPTGEIRFAHALVRDAVYATLSADRRTALHGRAAELLEAEAVGHDARAGAVARHWVQAGRPDRAAPWALRAADAARAAGAYDEAGTYLALALDAGGPELAVDRAELLLDLARTRYLAGQLIESMALSQQAAELGERSDRPDVVARAALVVQGIGNPALNTEIVDLARRALAVLPNPGATALRARVEAQLACGVYELGEVAEADRWSTRALADAEESGDPNAELDAIWARATLAWRPGSDSDLLELGRRAVELARPLGRPVVELFAHGWRGDCAVRLAEPSLAGDELAEMRRLAERTGLPLARWHWLRRTATFAALRGEWAACRAATVEADRVAADWHDDSIRGTQLGLMVMIAALRGDAGDLPADWEEFVHRSPHIRPVARACTAAALLVAGRPDEAVAATTRYWARWARSVGWTWRR